MGSGVRSAVWMRRWAGNATAAALEQVSDQGGSGALLLLIIGTLLTFPDQGQLLYTLPTSHGG